MANWILEGFRTITDIDTFPALVLAGLVMTAYALLKATTGSILLGTIFLPFLALGGLISKYHLDQTFINPLNDKDANTVLFISIGVLVALIIMTALAKLVGSVLDWRWRQKRPGNHPVHAE